MGWNCTRPSLQVVADTLSKLIDSGTGPDGIPYSAWKAYKKMATLILWKLLGEICNFGYCPFGFH
eukprot:1315208-Karenia_brevis.AAC.1